MSRRAMQKRIREYRRENQAETIGMCDAMVEALMLGLDDVSTEALVQELQNRRYRVVLQ